VKEGHSSGQSRCLSPSALSPDAAHRQDVRIKTYIVAFSQADAGPPFRTIPHASLLLRAYYCCAGPSVKILGALPVPPRFRIPCKIGWKETCGPSIERLPNPLARELTGMGSARRDTVLLKFQPVELLFQVQLETNFVFSHACFCRC